MNQERQSTFEQFESETGESVSDTTTLSEVPDTWLLLYHTVRNMKPTQVGGTLERKTRHAVVPRLPIDFDDRYEQQVPASLSPNTAQIVKNLA